MYNLIKKILLELLKVPPEPNDPFGEEDSVRVFRASPNYLKYKLILWAIGALILTVVAVAGLGFLHVYAVIEGVIWLHLLGLLGWFLFVVLIFFSYMSVRLDYEMRWYKVSDRSLRIREGVWFVREMTMTFANIQNLSITQGPLQRYFGISDLKVQTAGGGGQTTQQQQQQPFQLQMHIGYFRGVDNAEEIRNLIRERLRQIRDTGLGDTDESQWEPDEQAPAAVSPDVIAALSALRDEAHAFRVAAEGRSAAS